MTGHNCLHCQAPSISAKTQKTKAANTPAEILLKTAGLLTEVFAGLSPKIITPLNNSKFAV